MQVELLCAGGIKNLVQTLTLPDPAMGDRPSCRETAASALVALCDVNKIAQASFTESFRELSMSQNPIGSTRRDPLSRPPENRLLMLCSK